MTNDEAKAELKEVAKCNRLIKTLQETISQNRARLTSISVQLSSDKVQTTHTNDKMAEGVAEIMSLEADLRRKVKELTKKIHRIMRKIDHVPGHECQTILIDRYINGKDWPEIADLLQISLKRTHQLHGIALKCYSNDVQ